jgi:hypothetical protein
MKSHVLCTEDTAKRVCVIGDHPASIDQAHAIGRGLRGHGILYATAQLVDGGCSGEVGKRNPTFNLGRWRQDPEVDSRALFRHCDCSRGRVRPGGEVRWAGGRMGDVAVYVAVAVRSQLMGRGAVVIDPASCDCGTTARDERDYWTQTRILVGCPEVPRPDHVVAAEGHRRGQLPRGPRRSALSPAEVMSLARDRSLLFPRDASAPWILAGW